MLRSNKLLSSVQSQYPGEGGAIFAGEGSTIENCTLLANEYSGATGIAGIAMAGGGTVHAVILMGSVGGATCSGTAVWSCCDLYSNADGDTPCGVDGGGNFQAAPLFCGVDPIASGNVFLQQASPCAPGNHAAGAEFCPLIGAAPVGCTVAVQRASWSEVKQLFR